MFWHAKSCWQHKLLISILIVQERSTIDGSYAEKAEKLLEDYQLQLMEASGICMFRVSWQCHSLQQLQLTPVAVHSAMTIQQVHFVRRLLPCEAHQLQQSVMPFADMPRALGSVRR